MFLCVTYLRNYKLCYRKQKRNYGNFHLFAANEKRKRQISLRLLKTEIGSFSSLVGKTIFGNRGLPFQRTCPSVKIACETGSSTQHVVNYSSIKQRCMNDRATSFKQFVWKALAGELKPDLTKFGSRVQYLCI